MPKKAKSNKSYKEKCFVCGNTKNNRYLLFCANCGPHIYKEGKFPHQLIENTKEHKDNEAEKLKEAGNKGEECGSIAQELFVYFEDVNPRSYIKNWEGAIKWALLDFLLKERFRLEYADLFMVGETKKQYKERLNFYELKK